MERLWFWIVSVMVAVYAVLDGFDFGAGILHPCVARSDGERRQVLGAVGPLWDGNEVWLLAGGGALFLAFPKVLAAGFSGFYMAFFMVIWTLLLRGISIEFRSHLQDGLWRTFWDHAFAFASLLMPVLLGAALGNVLRGVPLDATGAFNLPLFTHFGVANPVGILDWYTVLVGVFALLTVTAHGALFLAWKTDGPVRERCLAAAGPLWIAVAACWLLATAATAAVNPALFRGFARAPLAWVGAALFLAGLVVAFAARKRPLLAFLGSGGFIVGLLAASAASVWPVMLGSTLDPAWSLTAHNASAAPHGLRTGFVCWIVALPLVVAYFVNLFRAHRGKVVPPAEETAINLKG